MALRIVGHLAQLAEAPRALRGLALAGIALGASPSRRRPVLLARYYLLTQASIALGLADHLRHGTEAGWDPPEGTR